MDRTISTAKIVNYVLFVHVSSIDAAGCSAVWVSE